MIILHCTLCVHSESHHHQHDHIALLRLYSVYNQTPTTTSMIVLHCTLCVHSVSPPPHQIILHCTVCMYIQTPTTSMVILYCTVCLHSDCHHHHQHGHIALYSLCVHSDSHHQSARYVEQLEADLNSANKHIRSLRDELQQTQSSVFKLEADGLGQTVSGRLGLTALFCIVAGLTGDRCSHW